PVALLTMAACGWRAKATAQFCLGGLPGVAILLGLNTALYGHPFSSGYGDPSQLFSLSFAPANISNYARALYDTQNLFPVLALAAPLVLAGTSRRIALLGVAVIAIVIGVYMVYQ